ncbi:zinc ribbon domain-containing protein [Streptomyces endophyticus]|uniref:Zinc ribbon domain-containing protein n=1 Tax=Streptomyces endophyticus TaxID=714166 RepID=A0ABU6F7R5_9ACTN|nr:zinc ribbon domain-containing protein [Streptomyces endophyticus]MEB8340060.1 zinc ribbon domain-containing protein [Streptomyces endophyticus]
MPTVPSWGRGTDLTRYMCAAVFLDRDYADSLIKEVAAEPHLGVAPAPGCDVPVVLRYAYEANARRHARDLLLAVECLALIGMLLTGNVANAFFLLLLFLAWLTVLVFTLSTTYGERLQRLRPDRFDPGKAPAPPNDDAARRLREIKGYADGNVTAYSGFSPFAAYGTELDSWSLLFDVTRSGVDAVTPAEFDVADLYAHVASRVGSLSLPCLEIEERVFVEGSAVRFDERFLPDPLGRPVADLGSDRVSALKRVPEDAARPYLSVHSTGWGGELVTSVFLRFVRSDSTLFVEAVPTVLCPLRDRYRAIDSLMPSPSPREFLTALGQAAFSTPFVLLAAPFRAVTGFSPDFRIKRRLRRQHRQIAQLKMFDYGARQGVRRLASADEHRRHFQRTDSGMVLKAVERRVLDALVEFAEAHDIDPGDLKRRQELIINNGIIATAGASVESSSVASGDRSRISAILGKIPRPNTD